MEMSVPHLPQSAVPPLALSHAASVDAQGTKATTFRVWWLLWQAKLSTGGTVQLKDAGKRLIGVLPNAIGAETYRRRYGY
jgi:hypothetical protein